MSTPQERLDSVRSAIDGLVAAMADLAVQEYQTVAGNRVKRADFPRTLEALQKLETQLMKQVAATRSNVTYGQISGSR